MNGKRVLVAMSGGVDSSVAAWLLQQQGYECVGVTMKLLENETLGEVKGHPCCTLDDVEDAKSVARRLGMPHYVFSFADDFREKVIDRYLATGHYARITERGGRFLLGKGLDAGRDQSYVLSNMTQEQLAHTLFPLGGLHKTEVRRIAEEQGFVNARKHDSQDICFVPDGDYLGFMERYTGKQYEPGDLIDREGAVLGRHRGAAGYTLGQRRGLGVAGGERLYVCDKCMADNTVTLGPESALYSIGCAAEDWNWIIPTPDAPFGAKAKLRYRQTEQPVTVRPDGERRVRLDFAAPQRAVTPGQAAVLYDGDTVIGGGTVTAVFREN